MLIEELTQQEIDEVTKEQMADFEAKENAENIIGAVAESEVNDEQA